MRPVIPNKLATFQELQTTAGAIKTSYFYGKSSAFAKNAFLIIDFGGYRLAK